MYTNSILTDYHHDGSGFVSHRNRNSSNTNANDHVNNQSIQYHNQDDKHQHQFDRREKEEGSFVRGGIQVKLRILLDAYDQLVNIYVKNKEIAYEEIHYSVINSFNHSKHRVTSDASVYMSLLVESVLTPKISDEGNLTLQIKLGHLHDIHDKILRYSLSIILSHLISSRHITSHHITS